MKSAWPITAELEAMYASQGLTPPDAGVLETTLGAAVQWWEERTGFKPWLADATEDSVLFDPPALTYLLDLRGGFFTVSSVKVGVTTDSAGLALVAGQDYQLLPSEGQAKRKPYTSIRFLSAPGTLPLSVQVTGRRGYWNEIEDDVWLAVRNLAFAQSIVESLEGASMVDELTQGPIKIKYGNAEGMSKIDRYKKDAAQTAKRYMRIEL